MPKAPPNVACPSCGAQVEWTAAARYRPFCSERCKVLDFGAWATERYRVAGEDAPNEPEPGQQTH